MAQCNKQIPVKGQWVPCGRCRQCRKNKSSDWALRLRHEQKYFKDSVFITLTYDDESLPVDLSVNKRDVQLFLKRLRKNVGSFRYYAVGEYGGQTKRPHYHAILFGISNTQRKEIDDAWGLGFTTIGRVEPASIAYTTKYIQKKLTGPIAEDHYKGRQKEFALMSRKPGIGFIYGKKWINDWMDRGYIIDNGIKRSIPAYYQKLVEEEVRKEFQATKVAIYADERRRVSVISGINEWKIDEQKRKGGEQREIDLKSKENLRRDKI